MQQLAYEAPRVAVPRSACDCHMHIFGAVASYPPAPARTYTPQPAPLSHYKTMAQALHLDRVVFVQASAYGSDNACLLDAMEEFGAGARGVAGIDKATSDETLQHMHRKGVCGVRLNPASRNLRDAKEIQAWIDQVVEQIAPLGWHLQLFTSLSVIHALKDYFLALPVPVVFDHMGHARHDRDPCSAEFQSLIRLLETDNCWIKLSGADRVSRSNMGGFFDALPIMRALIDTNPDRLVWGSDWPHTGKHGHSETGDAPLIQYRPIQTAKLLDLLAEACLDSVLFERILVTNPTALYGFEDA